MMMRAINKIVHVLTLAGMLVTTSAITAAPVDALPDEYEHNQKIMQLYNRLDRLDRDFIQLQQYLSTRPGSVAPEAAEGALANPMRVAKMEARMGDIEEKLRQLNGKVEELTYNTSRILEKMDHAKDAQARASLTPDYPVTKDANATNTDAQVLGKIGTQDLADNTKAIAAATATGTAVTDDTAEEMMKAEENDTAKETDAKIRAEYQSAFALVRKTKFSSAEKALQEFIKAYPKHTLAGNAYYWLGEVYYVQTRYEKAAAKFLRGYRDFPQGKWAADSLYKVALSLVPLKKKEEACSTLRRLEKEFPAVKEPLKSKVQEQKTTLACQ
jgi:tol-pal system protein YbgF